MITKKIDHLDLKQTAESGQCFRWQRLDEKTYNIVAFGKNLNISGDGDVFTLDCTEEDWQNIWYDYFDMGTDYFKIEELIKTSGDEHLLESFREGSGIRILRQDIWEMVITFMISQNNNISRITKTVEMLCDACGGELTGTNRKSFPGPADAGEEIFADRSFGFGYRDAYLKEMFSFGREHFDQIEALRAMDYDTAMEALLKHRGIGKKVANCICLFGLHHVGAFPVDTHVKQLLEKYYPDGFDFERYSGCAGIIQQYLFYYELNHS